MLCGRQPLQAVLVSRAGHELGVQAFMVKAVKADAAPLRLGVVGVGVMGYNHARVLAELPGVHLVGVADPDDRQADFVRRTLACAAATRACASSRERGSS